MVQYAGDYRKAYRLLSETGKVTYFSHKAVLNTFEHLSTKFEKVGILCCNNAESYWEDLPNGVCVIAASLDPKRDQKQVLALIEKFNPTHLIVTGPLSPIIKWGIDNDQNILCMFADSFDISLIYRLWRYGRLPSLLNNARIGWIGNHGRNACRSLARIGVDATKILPWDWSYTKQPDDLPPKTLTSGEERTMCYVGSLHRTKGIGDVIKALGLLKAQGVSLTLNVAGGGDQTPFRKIAEKLGVDKQVRFLGVISNDEVAQLMRDSTLVVVPSRRAFPEGLPLTIYEALCSRTPIVASNHPMFVGNLTDRVNASIFQDGDARSLSRAILEILNDPEAYSRYSSVSQSTWEALQIKTKWPDLVIKWALDAGDEQWFKDRTIGNVEKRDLSDTLKK